MRLRRLGLGLLVATEHEAPRAPAGGTSVRFRAILHEGVAPEGMRPALAAGIRRTYAALFAVPADAVAVDFTELSRGRFFTAGRPSTSSIVAGTVPAGTSTAQRHRLLSEITTLWCETTGCTPHEIVVSAGDAAP
jgi:phenylpyruvate tautomerase PptA (4-oxalocrotonate tautomerase family)